MTDTQFLTIVATILIAPHLNKWYGLFVGLSSIGLATLKGLGWM